MMKPTGPIAEGSLPGGIGAPAVYTSETRHVVHVWVLQDVKRLMSSPLA